MMRACAEVTRPAGVHTVVSLNTIMVDGTGMCGSCRVSVDGVTNTAEDTDATAGAAQTYIDNVSVSYLLDPDGNLRIKLFNDRDRNEFVGGNTIRFGGRLVFSKDFERFFWEKK